ncbi:prephenate dehydratase domain-containing protein [Buchnera aphidicola]|uniref:prephenate dehydratase domain-containing protein n=1 Tax=Buchnera aphidicola TaxID=9 RepID=UPI003464A1DE
MENKKSLLNLRNSINDIDNTILHLLEKRKKISIKIAKIKLIYKYPIEDKKREQELINRLIEIGKKKSFSENYVKRIFKIIINDSVKIQKSMIHNLNKKKKNIIPIFSYLGNQGSYSQIACMKYIKKYQKKYIIKKNTNFINIFYDIEQCYSDYAIIPIENNCTGFIHSTYRLLIKTKSKIIGSFYLSIKHCLLSKYKINLNEITTIYSHSQPLKQCSKFINTLNKCKIQYTKNTSEAMKIISQSNKKNEAAIGDQINAKLHSLSILKEKISNKNNNKTKFLILSNKIMNIKHNKPQNITMILTTTKIMLIDIIYVLKKKKICNIKLKSKLYRNNLKKEKIYLEIKEQLKSKKIKNLLETLQKKKITIKILGYYPSLSI